MSVGSHVHRAPDPALTAMRGQLASAMAQAVAAKAGAGGAAPARPVRKTNKKRAAEWLRVGAALSYQVGAIAARADLMVEVRPRGTRAGAKAVFYPDQAKIEIEAKAFGRIDPASIDPDILGDRERYAAAWGALTHEAAHARHSRWNAPREKQGSAAAEAADMLEESRAEARLLESRPGDTRWLGACVAELVLPSFPTTLPDTAWSAGMAAGLIAARADAGIVPKHLAVPVEYEVRRVIGHEKFNRLQMIWTAARSVADEDAATMLHLGKLWCETLDVEAEQPAPDGQNAGQQQGPGAPGAGGAPTSTRIGAAVRRAARKIAKQAAIPAPSPKAQARIRAQRASKAGQRVFGAPAPDPNDTSIRTPITGVRRPSVKEKAAAARLGRALRQAGTRERQEIRSTSIAPPGRLGMRAALAREAQRAAGAMPSAEPWVHTARKSLPNPPVRVGILADVSGSMQAFAKPVASAAWIMANATYQAGVDNASATIAFASQITVITRPGRPPTQVTEFDAHPGRHRISESIDALTGALALAAPGAARLLVIASDAAFEPAEIEGARERIAHLIASGCAVLWLDPTGTAKVPNGVTCLHLSDPAEAPEAIAKAATRALAAAAR
ncbi:VWA domain-containing protein [Actinospica robiniae]|uniref:VWA domain-containing protein n=1 Tax=Actinospica robiniae TaxID=304901 RepID=UPI000A01BC30|nr:VWA domain-containing protein [Actinospica robiniae]